MVIADSWFGNVKCVEALFARRLFAVMNVKTAHTGYPKAALLNVVGEIKGNSADAKARRRARRGKAIAYTKKVNVNGDELTILAAGHNKKVPLLLVASHSTMNPGDQHVKKWTVPRADGSLETHQIVTDQPQVHQLYRENMNVVDVHNKLRQGVCSMADVWRTTNWVERHFAELLGIIEVNIFKTITHFIPDYQSLGHPDFRRLLAWHLMTLGQVDCPLNEAEEEVHENSGLSRTDCHQYARFQNGARHRCAYCGLGAYYFCASCRARGHGTISICGRKSGRNCVDRHAAGEKPRHACWTFSKKRKSSEESVLDDDDEADTCAACEASASCSASASEAVSRRPRRSGPSPYPFRGASMSSS